VPNTEEKLSKRVGSVMRRLTGQWVVHTRPSEGS
jgi:hypothetical protein